MESKASTLSRTGPFFFLLFAVTLALRLCHSGLLWPDEDYHLAAAMQLLHGKMLYRDFWYDKPPLSALTYALTGAPTGWALRLFDTCWIFGICAVAFRLARDLWGETEGLIAAALLAFFLSFDLPGGVIPIAPDFFMVLPHLLAVWCAWKNKPLVAGGWCGVAFLFNPKGAFVLMFCCAFLWQSIPMILLGFVIPNAVALATLYAQGALGPYLEQVWRWGLLYAKVPPAASTFGNGFRRTTDWFAFHAVVVAGAGALWIKDRSRASRFALLWAVISFAGVASGGRFANRYFLELLPVLAVVAGRGYTTFFAERPRRPAILATTACLLIIPLVRFGPRYVTLGLDLLGNRVSYWSDTALDRDSRTVSQWLLEHRRPDDTLFVWGYRPDMFAYTRMPFASLFWDSQPLTGVPADRHLTESVSLNPAWAAENRRALIAARPSFLVDGLSRLNPKLALGEYPELRDWLREYTVAQTTSLSVIYVRTAR